MNARIAQIGLPLAAIMLSIGIGFAGITSAQSANNNQQGPRGERHMGDERPVVVGEITVISGTALTVTGIAPGNGQGQTETTYTVDASSAKVLTHTEGQGPTETTLSTLKVGDKIGVRGTLSGTWVTATEIMSGIPPHGFGEHGKGHRGGGTRGTVTAVNGNTITITGANGTTYTVDASSAKVSKIMDISVGDIKVGDEIGVQGPVSGSSISAKHILDGIPPKPQQ